MSHGTDTRRRRLAREIFRIGARFLLVPDAHGMQGVKLGAKFVLYTFIERVGFVEMARKLPSNHDTL